MKLLSKWKRSPPSPLTLLIEKADGVLEIPRSCRQIEIIEGTAWISFESCHTDYVLSAGQGLCFETKKGGVMEAEGKLICKIG